MNFIRPALALAALSPVSNLPASSTEAMPARPNILFILCDDLGPGDIGVLWQDTRPPDRRHHTPHLDQMAAEGRILSRHYSNSPVCAPARASLLTGQHQGHSDIRDNQFDKALPDTHTLATVLKEADYATAIIGKWGLQGGAGFPGHPLNRGFDYFFGYIAHEDGHFHYPYETNRPFYENFTDVSADLQRGYSTDLITARAKQWIIDHHTDNPDQPFFIYLSQVAPHAGLRVPTTSHLTATSNYPPGLGLHGGVQWLGTPGQIINTAAGAWDEGLHPDYANATSNGQPWPDYAKRYATMVRRLDDSTADLIQLLKDLGLDDNTLIVFTSDNGTQNAPGLDNVGVHDPRFFHTFGPYDGIKRDLWEGGIRMPTLVRWPAAIPPGTTTNEPSQFHDWMATFAELAGLPAPAFSDGRSIVPKLTGVGEQAPGTVYVEYFEWNRTPNWTEFESPHRNQLRQQMQAVYIGPFKGVRYNITGTGTPFRVYNVVEDIKETTNLAGQEGVPTQADFEAAFLRQRRAGAGVSRPYDSQRIPPVMVEETVPGLQFHRHAGAFPWVPQFTGAPAASGIMENLDTLPAVLGAPGGLELHGLLTVPTDGTYTFFATTHGRAVVRLHDALLIDADAGYTPGAEKSSGPIPLRAGTHPIRIRLIHGAAGADFDLKWQGPSLAKSPVPSSAFSHGGTPPELPPHPGFLWLPMDESTGSAVSAANGIVKGTAVGYSGGDEPWIPGRHGRAARFNGTGQRLDFDPGLAVVPTGNAPRTFSAWLRPASTQPQLGAWLSYGTAATGQRMTLRVDTETGVSVLRCEIQGAFIRGTTALTTNEWQHVAIVLDDLNGDGTLNLDEARFYVNGQPEPTTTASAAIQTGTTLPLSLGGSMHNTGFHYAGDIDDVRIYPRALSAGEVADLAAGSASRDLWSFHRTATILTHPQDWLADTTGNGLSLLAEYALGLDPTSGSLPPTPSLNVGAEGTTFQFSLRASDDGFSHAVEWSHTLADGDWQLLPAGYVELLETTSSARRFEATVSHALASENPLFVRLSFALSTGPETPDP
ncbi:MAG: sulfatase-like hydrolase/transferase [Opitutales bacterium]|nr:sulfatase-like hydrolase/transferase [Opitutales bacterium]